MKCSCGEELIITCTGNGIKKIICPECYVYDSSEIVKREIQDIKKWIVEQLDEVADHDRTDTNDPSTKQTT